MNAHHNKLMEKLQSVFNRNVIFQLLISEIAANKARCRQLYYIPKVAAETIVLNFTEAIAIDSLPTSINPSKSLHHCRTAITNKRQIELEVQAICLLVFIATIPIIKKALMYEEDCSSRYSSFISSSSHHYFC